MVGENDWIHLSMKSFWRLSNSGLGEGQEGNECVDKPLDSPLLIVVSFLFKFISVSFSELKRNQEVGKKSML